MHVKPCYKPITTNESNLFKVDLQDGRSSFEYPWHYHPEYELTYIRKSHGIRYVGNSIENFSDDDLVLVGSNLPHSWMISGDETQRPDAIVVYLKQEFADNAWMRSSEFEAIQKILKLSSKGLKFDKQTARRLRGSYANLLTAKPLDKLIIILQILSDLANSASFEFLCADNFTYDINETQHHRLNAVYKYIQDNYRQKVTLSSDAAEVNMSEEYFSRFFSKIMKKSFFEFLNEYRINRACKLLIETDKQVSEVCYDSGFESDTFFYRQFKKFKKCQPKVYRQTYLKVSDVNLMPGAKVPLEAIND